jgi:hypothetical protein
MTEIQSVEPGRCAWIKDDGERCKRAARRDSDYCWSHQGKRMDQAAPIEADAPAPAGTDPAVIVGMLIGLSIGAVFWIGLLQSERWVGWRWLDTIRRLRTEQLPPETTALLLAWLVANTGSGIWVVATVPLGVLLLAVFPMRPGRRRRWIRVLIGFQIAGLVLQIVSLPIFFWMGGSVRGLGSLATDLPVQLAFTAVCASILYAADKGDTKVIDAWATPLLAVLALINLLRSASNLIDGDTLQEPTLWILGQCLVVLWAVVILSLTVTIRGRIVISSTVLLFLVGRLADALRPAEGEVNPRLRRDEMKALVGDSKTRLTDEDIRRLKKELLAERRSNWIKALVTLVLAQWLLAMFVEAPAQQLFIWLACTRLQLGEPLCPPG